MTPKVKAVSIEDGPRDTWVVAYVLHAKYKRYWAAQFDKRDKSKAEVEQWVRQQDHLQLLP